MGGSSVTRRLPAGETCFLEQDPDFALWRRALAECVGTFLLMLIVTGAGRAARHLWHGDPLVGLVAGALATAGALTGLIIALGAVSGGHFNPLITGLQWLAGERNLGCTMAYTAAQFIGAVAGAILATFAFGAGARAGATLPVDARVVVGEMLATVGLLVIVFGCSRSGKRETGPFAIGVWLASAIIATLSTSYANPAVTLGALFATGPVALAPSTAVAYFAAELAGALAAFAVISMTYPARPQKRPITPPPALSIEGVAP